MRYLKIYENYFLEKDKVKEASKKLDDDLSQEILDLIPDINSIDSFKYRTSVKTDVITNHLFEFEFHIMFEKMVSLEDYKDTIIKDLYRLNSILGKDYDITHSIEFIVYKKEYAKNIISRENFNKINFEEIKKIIESMQIFLLRLSRSENSSIDIDNDKLSFFSLKIHLKRL